MDMSRADGLPSGSRERAPKVIWHDVECGSYRADLPLWRELARSARADGASARILEVGCGTGRVALELARDGHSVCALDREPQLLGALAERAAGDVEIVCADARSFELSVEFDLCIVPMQTVQLLEGQDGRTAFLRRARAQLRVDGLLACAIVTEVEEFDCAAGEPTPQSDCGVVDGLLYLSRATRAAIEGETFVIERERKVIALDARAPADEHPRERSLVRLDLLSASQLSAEALLAGLTPAGTRTVSPTAEHIGSEVVVLRA